MHYISTRGGDERVTAAGAIVRGLAGDGGLFVPESFPMLSLDEIRALSALPYWERALRVLAPWLDDFSEDELSAILKKAYGYGANFGDPACAPVVSLDADTHVLELFHGPTLAFKDMALQLLPHLLTACAAKVGERREIAILVATSGDTGKAALEGFADVPGTSISVFYPKDGVSEAQRLQMVTQVGANTHVLAVKGNFDDAQTGVKRIFSNADFAARLDAKGIVLSSANSINLGRLLPQIVYYMSAYADLTAQGALEPGQPLDVCVPTGNFGNILAAYYAKRMGLPVGRLMCASNSNNVLSDFIRTGVYDRNREFHLTSSPSMDILISSNLERMVFHLVGACGTKHCMEQLVKTGKYELPANAVDALQSLMLGGWASEDEVFSQIRATYDAHKYVLDPHTAVAARVLCRHRAEEGATGPALIVVTASPYKFGHAVLSALSKDRDRVPDDEFACCELLSGLEGARPVPESIESLPSLPVLHRNSCTPDGMGIALAESLGI